MVAYHGTRILSDKWALQAPKSLGILCGGPVSPWGRWVEVAPLHVWQIISCSGARCGRCCKSGFALVTEILVYCKFDRCWAHQALLCMVDVFWYTWPWVSWIGFFGFASMRMMIRGRCCKKDFIFKIIVKHKQTKRLWNAATFKIPKTSTKFTLVSLHKLFYNLGTYVWFWYKSIAIKQPALKSNSINLKDIYQMISNK